MLEQHICINAGSIERLESTSTSISTFLLGDTEPSIDDILLSITEVDQQSLFYWKFLAGAYHNQSQTLINLLNGKMRTEWLKHRFLYPFAFHSFNPRPQHLIPQTLEYVLSGEEKFWEKKIIEYAVGYRQNISGNEIPFFWAALLMHPYDALELISECLDIASASNKKFPE